MMLGALAPNGVLDLAGGAGGASVVPVRPRHSAPWSAAT